MCCEKLANPHPYRVFTFAASRVIASTVRAADAVATRDGDGPGGAHGSTEEIYVGVTCAV